MNRWANISRQDAGVRLSDDDTENRKPKTENRHLDDLDKAILNEIQSHFPIVSRPYAEVGSRVGASEDGGRAPGQAMIEAASSGASGPISPPASWATPAPCAPPTCPPE